MLVKLLGEQDDRGPALEEIGQVFNDNAVGVVRLTLDELTGVLEVHADLWVVKRTLMILRQVLLIQLIGFLVDVAHVDMLDRLEAQQFAQRRTFAASNHKYPAPVSYTDHGRRVQALV